MLKPDIQAFPTDTYYDLAPQWEIGEILSINADTMFNDVIIKALQTEVLGGTGTLDGYITESSKKSGGIVKAPKITGGNPVKSAGVILIGRSKGVSSGTVLSKTVTDDLGHYSFQNIPLGSYDLLVDILGIPLVDYYTVDVVDQSANISNLNYLVGSGGITIPSEIQERGQMEVLLYPNPTRGELNILFREDAGEVKIRLYDLSGRLVHTYEHDAVHGSVLSLDLGSRAKGWYTLVLTGASGTETRKIILQ
ncbi:MAG: T9SS type A sorting domain-containing protein [Bacteroidales bacterium]